MGRAFKREIVNGKSTDVYTYLTNFNHYTIHQLIGFRVSMKTNL